MIINQCAHSHTPLSGHAHQEVIFLYFSHPTVEARLLETNLLAQSSSKLFTLANPKLSTLPCLILRNSNKSSGSNLPPTLVFCLLTFLVSPHGPAWHASHPSTREGNQPCLPEPLSPLVATPD